MNQRPKPNEKTAPARQPLEIVELSTVAAAPPPNIAEILEAVVELRAAACRFCSLVVVDEAELAQHERLHRADGKFVCCVCQAAMDGQTERYLHEQRFHRLKRPPEFAAAVGDANLKLSDHECAWRLNAGLPRLLAEADEAPAAREPKARRSKRLLEKEKKRPPRVRHMNPPNFRPVYPIAFRCTCCPQDFATARERNEHENAVHRLVRPPKEAAWEEEGSTDPKEMRHVINWPVPTVVQRPQRNPAAKRPPGIPWESFEFAHGPAAVVSVRPFNPPAAQPPAGDLPHSPPPSSPIAGCSGESSGHSGENSSKNSAASPPKSLPVIADANVFQATLRKFPILYYDYEERSSAFGTWPIAQWADEPACQLLLLRLPTNEWTGRPSIGTPFYTARLEQRRRESHLLCFAKPDAALLAIRFSKDMNPRVLFDELVGQVLPPLGLAALIVASNSDLENFRAKGLQTDGLVFG